MNLKASIRNAVTVCVAISWTGYAATPGAQLELIAAGLEEHAGRPADRVALTIYQGDAPQAWQKIDFGVRSPIKRLSLPAGTTYRLSFVSREPDEQGATSCAASAQLPVVAAQSYRIAFTLLKQTCMLAAGRIGPDDGYEEITSAAGKMRRLKGKT